MQDFSLPQAAEHFLPHRAPFCLLGRILSCDDSSCRTEAMVTANGIMVAADGALEPVALVEMLAQSFAAMRGYDDQRKGRPVREGFLVGVRHLHMQGTARVGERLEIAVRTSATVGSFAVAEGEVWRDGEQLASGSLKLWIPEPA